MKLDNAAVAMTISGDTEFICARKITLLHAEQSIADLRSPPI